ncbi:efflux RND transporter periplasmic adaptor subunit [Mesorhizobium muleiense]|uniref:RND family efflux transporter, MFP subunit n=1 Tax=Mesorhizobium muleiense TaxID=1004279 RepID=A0A1G9D246_9HYPH|nr:efflux RND transporter periplasmic adaptor subunit [Mesorhizobium muleiense]MCF6102710.1 efflux RND transporter periplasmic adaptor subunit [Mesorhizobium muleiense]SDK58016.1 RND family efflux transporter, MFP subunit [Mesorhizobium muleiense]
MVHTARLRHDSLAAPSSRNVPAKWLAAAAFAALGLLAAPAAQAQEAPPAPVVTVAKPLVRDIVEDDEFVGRFEAVDQVSLRSRVGGYLDQVHFQDGTLVKQGDLLFTIDQRPFKAALNQAQAQVDSAKTLVEFSKMQFERAETLSREGNIPVSTLDDRRREYLAAQAQLDGAEAALENASLDLEFTAIKAPFSGRVDRRLISPGNLVQADQTVLTTIVSIDPINFYFDIDERTYFSYARDARERGGVMQEGAGGVDVVVRVADRDEATFKGKLDFAENRLDQATGTMRARARFDNKDGVLQPGMFGRINVPGSLPHPGVLLPDEAIGADQNRRIVFVVDQAGLISAKPVRTGPRIDGYRVIREGLTGEETVVVNGLVRVRPGVTVKSEMTKLPPKVEAEGQTQ